MFSLKSATILALIGSALATPVAHPHHHRDNYQVDRPEVGRSGGEQGYNGKYVVVVTTTGGGNPNPPVAYKPPTVPAAPSPSATYGNSAPSSAPTTSTNTPTIGSSSGGDWLAIANKWRVAMGHPAFVADNQLMANIQECLRRSPNEMNHYLTGGSRGQVLAPGNANNFESVYVGGWLCENRNAPGLNGICATAEKGWDHSNGETGHADILNGAYTKIACALSSTGKIWGCDVA